jgi:hypothetical protein
MDGGSGDQIIVTTTELKPLDWTRSHRIDAQIMTSVAILDRDIHRIVPEIPNDAQMCQPANSGSGGGALREPGREIKCASQSHGDCACLSHRREDTIRSPELGHGSDIDKLEYVPSEYKSDFDEEEYLYLQYKREKGPALNGPGATQNSWRAAISRSHGAAACRRAGK